MKVRKEDLIGELSGFPIEVVEKMIECQVKQGNPEDIEVFQNYRCGNRCSGGFDWNGDDECNSWFWERVIGDRDFSVFFDKYPKSEEKKKEEEKEMVNHPSHYQGEGGLEVIDAMVGIFGKEETRIFCKLNAFKYNCRMSKKGKMVEDARKAEWYLNKFEELLK